MANLYHSNGKIKWNDLTGKAYHNNGKTAYNKLTGTAYHDNGKTAYNKLTNSFYDNNGRKVDNLSMSISLGKGIVMTLVPNFKISVYGRKITE
jgi:hypothetical protein